MSCKQAGQAYLLKQGKSCMSCVLAAAEQARHVQAGCGQDMCRTSAPQTQSYLQHDMHFPRGLQPLIFRPSKGVRCCQHNVQHHPTGPDVCNLQVTDRQLRTKHVVGACQWGAFAAS